MVSVNSKNGPIKDEILLDNQFLENLFTFFENYFPVKGASVNTCENVGNLFIVDSNSALLNKAFTLAFGLCDFGFDERVSNSELSVNKVGLGKRNGGHMLARNAAGKNCSCGFKGFVGFGFTVNYFGYFVS